MRINKQHKSTNYWEGNDPRSIMLHMTGGSTLKGAVDTLKARGLSYNYLIDQGKAYELVDYSKSAWHAGVVSKMNLRAKACYSNGKGENNPNRNSVGISFVQPFGVTELPDEDIDCAVQLIKWLGSKIEVRYTPDNIFYHREVTSYKPLEVKYYREQVLDALIGDKDHKDNIQKTILQLTIKVAQLRVKLLMQQLAALLSKRKLV